jgi:outer membrane receptor protein involved in Fe transport
VFRIRDSEEALPVTRRVSIYICGSLLCLMTASASAAIADLSGTAEDKSGGKLVGATILVLTPQRAVVATTVTDQSGTFTVRGLPDGQYLVVARYTGMADRQVSVTLSGKAPEALKLVLNLAAVQEDVSVTASPGALEARSRATQPVNVISEDDILARARTIVAQAVEGEPGVNLQRTSPGMAGIFVRGLTGNKVNIFVDGVRYSNGAQRGGVNTFLDLIDATTLDSIEVLRGTSSAQYGSDALGGSIQFQTHVPPLVAGRPALHGAMTVGGETAHQGGMGGASISYSTTRLGLFGSVSGRKTGDYRPGGGSDTHAAVTRFLGLDSAALYPDRMPGTGFHQAGGQVRANWHASNDTLFVANYLNTRQNGANRWDQTLGGDGNLIAQLNDLSLDLFYARLERLKAGVFDHVSVTYSLNTQHEERVNQGGNGSATATISHEPERTTVHGAQFSASRQISARQSLLVGGDTYFESLASVATNVNPVTAVVSARRPRVPDGATYRQGGGFAQTTIEAVPDRLVLVGAVRAGFNRYRARAADSPLVGGLPLWPDDALGTTSATFRAGATWLPTSHLTVTASVGTGYRAPHMTDLGTLGLTGAGFEVAAPDVVGLNAEVGSGAGPGAVTTGRRVQQVGPEKSTNVDVGVSVHGPRGSMRLGGFVNHIKDNIQKQALILPAGSVGMALGGQPVTSQNASGTVFVAASSSPVLVRANFDNARIYGWEWTGELTATPEVTIGSNATYMRAEDTTTGLAPNIEGGTPAPGGMLWGRYTPKKGHWWVQPYVMFAMRQSHLSSLDLTDRRTGAERTRSSIQNFFRNGARNRGWVNSGADGVANNADDILIATNETLLQVQDRVLGVGVNSSLLWTALPRYTLFGVRFGLRVGPHLIIVEGENLFDRSYRGISWGMDGPGRGVTARYQFRF